MFPATIAGDAFKNVKVDNMEKKRIVKYIDKYCVLVPKYYEHESYPSWEKYFVGSENECKTLFPTIPDYIIASYQDNVKNRHWKTKEYTFLISTGKTDIANKIKLQYDL